MAYIGKVTVYTPDEMIPAADGFVAEVVVIDPSALVEPRASGERGDTLVVWSPERGWLCEEHTIQPCEHTDGLDNPGLVLEV